MEATTRRIASKYCGFQHLSEWVPCGGYGLDDCQQSYFHPANRRRRQPLRLGCAVVGAILLIGLVFVGLRSGAAALPRSRRWTSYEPAGHRFECFGQLGWQRACRGTQPFRRVGEADSATVRSQAGPFLPATRLLGWLPQVGDEVMAAPDLLAMGTAAATRRTCCDGWRTARLRRRTIRRARAAH